MRFIYQAIKIFLQNFRDSFRFSLRKMYKVSPKRELDYELLIENILYGLPNTQIKRPKIKTTKETIKELINTNKSIVRFGDGEITIADGGSIAFQKSDKKLAYRLREILNTNQENLMIAINGGFYYNNLASIIMEKNQIYKDFSIYEVPKLRRQLNKYINFDITYYEAGITLDCNENFEIFRKFFSGKNLILVGCKEAFDSYEFNIFDTANTLCYEFVPNKNAFSEYEKILKRILKYDKNFICILMCGPTANVLAYDLTKAGFRALDLGHLAKSYDWYKKGIDVKNSEENTTKFFHIDK